MTSGQPVENHGMVSSIAFLLTIKVFVFISILLLYCIYIFM